MTVESTFIQCAVLARARLHIQRRLELSLPTDPSLRSGVRLEQREAPGPLALAAARLYASLVRVERPLRVAIPALCVGGATLGGSGKTPLAIAAARALWARGHRVALVGHAYRARPARARFVELGDPVAVVGDEALEAARELADTSVRVVVGPTRQDAVDLAQSAADVLVLDGPLQLSPRRARLSWLAVDPSQPWGSGACPPAGDLRAPKEALLAAADAIVSAHATSRGAWDGESLVGWADLRQRRIGLLTCVARPRRVLALLEKHGCVPARVLFGPDHGPLPSVRGGGVDLWLTTGKDWPRLPSGARAARPSEARERSETTARAARIDYHLRLPREELRQLAAVFPACPTAPRF